MTSGCIGARWNPVPRKGGSECSKHITGTRWRRGDRGVPVPCGVARQEGFTLIELLVVIAIIGILSSLLLQAIGIGIERGRQVRCGSNLRQLFMANELYADDFGSYVPAAADLSGKNLQRWHGTRPKIKQPFDGSLGPLVPYLKVSGSDIARSCPSLRRFRRSTAANAFEASCGGYGYNAVGVGSQTYLLGMKSQANQKGMPRSLILKPSRTVMFADTAFPQPYGRSPTHLIEYSFVEPYRWVFKAGEESTYRADPSIHFRHAGRANVAWCDGHVSSERLETHAEAHFTKWKIGWFGPADNSLFSPN